MSRSGIVIAGAGGHAKVIIELFREAGLEVAYCVGTGDHPGECLGVPVLGDKGAFERLYAEGFRKAFVAIGANPVRERLAVELTALGYELTNAISPRADISPTADIGVGVAVMRGAVINAAASISDLSIINTGATIDHDCLIGRNVHIAPQCALAGNVRVGESCFVGIGTVIIPDVELADRVQVAAGATVVSNLEVSGLYLGTPARLKRTELS